MSTPSLTHPARSVLIIGASRVLGHAMAEEFVKRGWQVLGTVLETVRTQLHDLAEDFPGLVQVESLEMCESEQISALYKRLAGRRFDMLFVNAGIAGKLEDTVRHVSSGDFIRIMATNAWSPMRVIESFEELESPTRTIGAMSAGTRQCRQQRDGR